MFYEFNHLGTPDYLKIEKNQNFSFPLHLHQCFEIITILSGKIKITVDKKCYILEKGDALLVFPNQIHSLESETCEHFLCIFSPLLVQAYSNKISGKIPKNNQFKLNEYLISSLLELKDSSSTTEKKGVLYSICAEFDKIACYEKKSSDSKKLLYKIFNFVEENYGKECTLYVLSKNIGYDYSYLSRYFKRTVGISFNAYVNHYRLSCACYALENTELPIIQCAYDCGFSSLRTFNRTFKEYYNITPTQYRKNLSIKL